MRRLRLALHSLLALVLFAQSLGVAAATRSLTAIQSGAQVHHATPSSMPCDAMMKMAKGTGEKPSCCNAACPDMLTCAFAAIVPAPALPRMEVIAESSIRIVEPTLDDPAAPQGATFRPPISLSA